MTIRSILATGLLVLATVFLTRCSDPAQKEIISFYNVPLVCGAAPEIGCGSRRKPLFIDTEKEKSIKESWTNRQGTVIAIVWNDRENEKLAQSLFSKHGSEAELVFDSVEARTLSASFREKGKWLKGMEVDQLSTEEAGVIAKSLTQFAIDEKLVTQEEGEKIRKDIEAYFKKELVMVRTAEELQSPSTQEKWLRDGYAVYEKHIGKQRADSINAYFAEHQGGFIEEGSCCDKEDTGICCEKKEGISMQSDITCPHCGHTKTEILPTDVCLLKYTCEKCKATLLTKDGDCCVFCSYGTHKCPSKQEE